MSKCIKCWIVLLGVSFVFFSCHHKGKLFTLVSHNRTGIKFGNIIEETENFNHLHYSYLYNGAGVAIGDLNNDGLAEIYFPGNLSRSKLYLNKGDFRFEDITEKAGVSAADTWNNGASMADINGDGFLDIYVCSSTDGRPEYRKNLLFINNGDLTFTEKAREYGIDGEAYSTHSAFFDYDKDGDLDLFCLNHSVDSYAMFNDRSPGYKNEPSAKYGHRLYRNDGTGFTDVTAAAGIISNVINFGLGIAVSDFNNDHWPDIYICNDYYEQDYLFINQKNGTFEEKLADYFNHVSFSSMGSDAADINNDGFIDLYTLDMLPEDNMEQKLVEGPHNYEKFKLLEKRGFFYQTTRNMLQLNNHGENFTEIGQYAGAFRTNWSWSPLFCDFDNDGDKDLFISNGYGKNNTHMDVIMLLVEEALEKQKGGSGMKDMDFVNQVPPTILKNYMFRNNGDLTFTDVKEQWGFDKKTLSNGAAYGDLDNDGDMDLVVNNINDYAFVYRNNARETTKNHYLKIRLAGTGMNTGGIGARIDVVADGKTITQEFMPSRGYMSCMENALIFGLGNAENVELLRIIWPDMRIQEIRDIKTDQEITLDIKNAVKKELPESPASPGIFRLPENDSILTLRHRENEFNDFKEQPLLPHLLSTQGPSLAEDDINGDGLEDVFIGGAMGFPGQLFVQTGDSRFVQKKMSCFDQDAACEDMGTLFVDVDQDGDPDLYVVSGGNEYPLSAAQYQDRLYINDGNGAFIKAGDLLPDMRTSGSCVRAGDFDNDGDPDLFIGGRLTPGLYPISPRSYILQNDGRGSFTDVTQMMGKELEDPGMVTDARWTDFDGDRLTDLILVGEWMPVRIFRNTGTAFQEIRGQQWMENSSGWWNRICVADFDSDGDPDYVLGNFGLNSEIKASMKEPVSIYTADFDNNGSMDAVMTCYNQGKNYPVYSRDDLAEQIGEISDRYPDYRSYADQTINDIFPGKLLSNAFVLNATNFNSSYLENKGDGEFELRPLPATAQFSPIYAIQAGDFNQDNHTDIVLAGNFNGFRIKYGNYDANRGLLLLGDGKGNFKEVPNYESGLNLRGEVRDIARIHLFPGHDLLIFARNNDKAQVYEYLYTQ